jgi:hypothetical protein
MATYIIVAISIIALIGIAALSWALYMRRTLGVGELVDLPHGERKDRKRG